jgi:putative hydrolase of HD superfamily
LLAMFLAEACFPVLDARKVMRMALLHDFGEIYAGDLTPADAVSHGEKYHREHQSIRHVLTKLPRGAEYVALWEEYEAGGSPEAQFVRQVDRLEMALQASVYEHQGLADLSEFFGSVEPALAAPPLQAILRDLERLRPVGRMRDFSTSPHEV